MKGKKLLLIVVAFILIILSTKACKAILLSNYKNNVVEQLEKYHSQNTKYPKTLDELSVGKQFDFFYETDEKDFFSISYSSGIMNCNHNEYNTKRKRWEQSFSY